MLYCKQLDLTLQYLTQGKSARLCGDKDDQFDFMKQLFEMNHKKLMNKITVSEEN